MDNSSARTLADLDDLDLQIIRLLQEDGRSSNVAIARRTGVSEPTIRKHIERLIQDGIIRITAVLNPRRAGYTAGVVTGIRTYPGRAREVTEQLLPLNEVVYVGYVTGRFDLTVEILFRDEESMLAFLSQRLGDFPGIAAIETSHILRADKINFDWKLPDEIGPAVQRAAADHSAGPAHGCPSIARARAGNGRRPTRRGAARTVPASENGINRP